MRKNIIIFIIIIVITLFFSSFVNADNCGGTRRCRCGDTLIENQTMWYDLVDCPEGGLMVGANNIILDCNGHLIDGENPGTYDAGVLLGNQRATVTNCNIQTFFYGIYASEQSSNHIITYNTVNDNSIYGIFFFKNYNNVVYGNTLINNQWSGIALLSSDNNIWNNRFEDNAPYNALEEYGSINNNWNISNIGNYWDDFPSNPGYPNKYEVRGPGRGIDWHPIWEWPDVWITLTPTGNNTFPASGGILEYNIEGGNNEPTNVILDIWIDINVPGWTHSYGPIVGPVMNFNMPAYPWQANFNRELNIPARAPAGTYTLNGYLGEYDTVNPVIYAESHFNFIKEGTERDSKFKLVDSGGVFK